MRNIKRLFSLTIAAFAATTAFAVRYWRGTEEGSLFSTPENWFKNDARTTISDTKPDINKGKTYWLDYNNGLTVFDDAEAVGENVEFGTGSELAFVWRATDPSYGLTASGSSFHLGYNADKSPTYLQIDSGTYSFPKTYIGYVANIRAGLTLNGGSVTANGDVVLGNAANTTASLTVNGGSFTSSGTTRIGYASGVKADLTIDGGALTTKVMRVASTSNVQGTLTVINGGTLKTTDTGNETLSICNNANSIGTVVLDGGTIDTSSGNVSMGYQSSVTATVHVVSGVWNSKGIRIGGKQEDTMKAQNGTGAVSSFVVDGGTVSLSAESGVGYCTNVGSYAEMIINGGDVNCGHTSFYVGDYGPGKFTMNGGTFTMPDSQYGFTIGHNKGGADVGTVVLNGGELTTGKLRTEYSQPGSKITFNGTTLRATRKTSDYLKASDNITCEVADGGLVFDTNGFDVELKHPLVLADGVTSAPLIKKGAGKLTISGAHPFTLGNIFVCEGTVKIDGTTYKVNSGTVGTVVDASNGDDLGVVKLHDTALDGWLNDADFANYAAYGADGNHVLEQPLSVLVTVNGKHKYYHNLETGKTYNDTLDEVSYSFTTEDLAPRTLRVLSTVNNAAVANVRDLGSWPIVSVDGTAKMNQGLIFRGAHLDAFVNATAEQKAASALAGLKTEIDLRKTSEIASGYSGVSESWAATNANYYNFSLGDSQLNGGSSFTNQLRNVFSTLGTSGAFPAYFHCKIGRDRTGVVARLLLGLMGATDEVICRDYLVSNFADLTDDDSASTVSLSTAETTLRYLLRGSCGDYTFTSKDAEYGVSVASRCRQYLEMCGVTYDEIKNITTALTGETPEEVLTRVNDYELANNVRTVSYVPYQGSTTTNATHRLPAGAHFFPADAPTRTGYIFTGWDTANEADGIVYATWEYVTRYWSDTNGETASFTNADNWNPTPEFVPAEIFVLNKGVDKIAQFTEGSVEADTLYVGWGSFDGGASFINASDTSDRCGRLDIIDGTLNVTNYLYVGGYRTTKNISSVVNVSGGRLVVGRLHVGDYSASGDRCDALNISGTGVVEVTTSDIKVASEYESGGAVAKLHITDNGVLRGVSAARFGEYGRGTAVLEDNAVMDVTGVDVFLGKGSGTYGEISLADSASLSFYDMRVGYDASSTGIVTVEGGNNATNITAGHYIYIGRKGTGTLTINSGVVSVASAVQIGYDGVSTTAGTLNLNGGKLITRQMKIVGTPATAVFNWNGGVLEYSAASGDSTVDIMPNSALAVNVLEGGAIYNAVVRDNEIINHALSGVGALTKTGDKQLTVAGAVALDGGFIVDEGTLVLSNVTDTEFTKLSVAEGATLDLNGAEVTVDEYVVGGEKQRGGKTYIAHNGTIHVKSTVSTGRKAIIR